MPTRGREVRSPCATEADSPASCIASPRPTTSWKLRSLRDQCEAAGAKPVDACSDRESVRVAGTIRSVTIRSRAGSPSLEVEIYDGSGTLTVVFLGRRRIPGIETGRSIAVYGRLTFHESRPTMFNPRYEFLSAEAGVG